MASVSGDFGQPEITADEIASGSWRDCFAIRVTDGHLSRQ